MDSSISEAIAQMQQALDLLDSAGKGHAPYACHLSLALELAQAEARHGKELIDARAPSEAA